MSYFKRFGLFILTNIFVVATISIILNLTGFRGYLTAYGVDYYQLMVFCLVWGFAGSFISLLMSKFIAKMSMGVKIVEKHGQYSGLIDRVNRLAQSAGIQKMPEVGVYDSPEINAFATGASKNNSLVAVSTGLLNRLSDDEVEGVLAHEIAHVANGDMVTMALIQGVMNAFVMFFARVAAFALSQVMRSNDDDRPALGGGFAHMITVFVFEMIFGFLAMFVIAFFSRYREFRADAGGAKLAGREKMLGALKRLQATYEGGANIDEGHKNMSAFKISGRAGVLSLLSTHPPLSERIKALEMYVR